MNTIIISTGDEILTGETLDTNMNWLCKKLTELNANILKCFTTGDNSNQLCWAIEQSIKQAELVIITGGLGPTNDDLTRFALAQCASVELIEDAQSLAFIESFFRSRNREMIPRNRIQAMLPKGATALDNHWGTAPGIKMRIGRADIFALPGVPSEMKQMFEAYIADWIAQRIQKKNYRKQIHCIGIGESNLVSKLEPIIKKFPDVRFGTTAKGGIISINLVSDNEKLLNHFIEEITYELGKFVIGYDEDTLASVIGELLKQNEQTLVTAESCTGGLIAKLITDVSGSSEYFLGGFVCYCNELKRTLLNVSENSLNKYGAVSQVVAREMAEGALGITIADWAISVTGIAGPTGGSNEKPVGLVYVGIANKNGYKLVKEFRFGNLGRETVRMRSAISALNLLRISLLNTEKEQNNK